MHWIDIAILVVIAIGTFFGLKIGLIKAALSLAGIIAGTILAGQFYVPLSRQLTFISQEKLAEFAAFAIIIVGTMIVAGALAFLLRWLISTIMLGWVNHLGGAVFGFFLAAIFCSALLALLVKFLGASRTISQSGLADILLDRFPVILGLLPAEFDSIRSFFQ